MIYWLLDYVFTRWIKRPAERALTAEDEAFLQEFRRKHYGK